ncbi:amino acid ABC transporter ATP-binding protein [Pseudomonas syringae pv. tomato]|uniref:Amino acid ABC transporter ATP-binding protein n=3 Tax=Pseudomonas syringae group TaxID=136849 RepID=A0AAW4E890_PSESX|nr:amino acid ABC transporter ATP-binding protein [Pseudomonas syringae pv. tomato]EEB58428.1 amino acid ABC transporter, ATP-binding protein [Pseudomonas syringae pv. tomato T1]KPB90813.1 Amino acid ABC transporter [Pseudomonas syringae pv. maculicola str. M6]KPY65498.1 Amino acid ABC transporter, ATP-binding protein [Pseudomonas syringae pv. spinaceae]KTC02434.1 amino acid ABC transporter ATP-binding protein [Pseudomonas syringae ICMP 11292]KWT07284.1 amino acid ABC transporter ATP-binding p
MIDEPYTVKNRNADRVLFMEGGRIVADGSPGEILLNPENERTRRFLQLVEQR